ncbi:uncharacterized protein LOC133194516 [Saccostrea echinata]|uniref:uncharacterized protein LOC133194516 n=1 Tax=Saccostrea echinata TaxID=191078 RepID=UPI002A7ED0D6|nr:uncharacterized protein LOC133194516 [Saccostrea echinata]
MMLSLNTLCIIPNVPKYCRALISRHFSKKTEYLEWKENLKYALENHHELYLRPIRIVNPVHWTSFSRAPLQHRRLKLADNDAILQTKFSTVFSRGFEDLKVYLCNDVVDTALCPLSALSVYLTELREQEETLKEGLSKYAKNDIPEIYVAALLTNHLLSCLVYGNEYLISKDYRRKPPLCPCSNNDCGKYITYGETGVGHADIWYGRPDVVVIPKPNNGYMVPLWYINEEEEDEEDEIRDVHPLEIKVQSKFKHFASQVLSQAITFAFYQSNVIKKRGIVPLTTLVPSLVLTPRHYYIILYDYKNDILLSSGHQDSSLWDDTNDCRLNLSAILHIWMVLNYKDFVPTLDTEVIHHFARSSNIHNILESQNLLEETEKISRKNSLVTSNTNDDDGCVSVKDIKDFIKDPHKRKWY